MNNVISWLLARLKEKTTWAGIINFLVTVIGIKLAPELADSIATAGVAVAGLILLVIKEKDSGSDAAS